MALYKALKAVNDRIGAMLGIINTIFLLMITVIIFAQVIFRYVLKAPLSWSEAARKRNKLTKKQKNPTAEWRSDCFGTP